MDSLADYAIISEYELDFASSSAEWCRVGPEGLTSIVCASQRVEGYNELQVMGVGSALTSGAGGGRDLHFMAGGFPCFPVAAVQELAGSGALAVGAADRFAAEVWGLADPTADGAQTESVRRITVLADDEPSATRTLLASIPGGAIAAIPDHVTSGEASLLHIWDASTASLSCQCKVPTLRSVGLLGMQQNGLLVVGPQGFAMVDPRCGQVTLQGGVLSGLGSVEAAAVDQAGAVLHCATDSGCLTRVELRKAETTYAVRVADGGHCGSEAALPDGGETPCVPTSLCDGGRYLSIAGQWVEGVALFSTEQLQWQAADNVAAEKLWQAQPYFVHRCHKKGRRNVVAAHKWHPSIAGLISSVGSDGSLHIWRATSAS